MAAIDYFLKLDGINGESADAKHKGEIEVPSIQLRRVAARLLRTGWRRRRRQSRDERLLVHGEHEQGLAPALPPLRAGQAHQAGDPDRAQGWPGAAGVPEDQAERRPRLVLRPRRRGGQKARRRTRSRSTSSSSPTTTRRRRATAPSTPRSTAAGTCPRTPRSEAAALPACGRPRGAAAAGAGPAGYTGAGIARRLHTSGEPIFTHVDLEVYRPGWPPSRIGSRTPDRAPLLGDDVPAGEPGALLVETGVAERRDGLLRGSCASSRTTTS